MPKRSGFTLIELLVVITIIGILSTIGLLSYLEFLQNGRDTKRFTDMGILQSALEQYRTDLGFYPQSISWDQPLTEAGRTYLSKLPSDPLLSPHPQYNYTSMPSTCNNTVGNNKCLSYCLYAKLENDTSQIDQCDNRESYNLEVTKP